MKKNLLGLSYDELFNLLNEELDVKKYQVKQIYSWIYHHGARNFLDMTNISKKLQKTLEDRYEIKRLKVLNEQKSIDGTVKWLLETEDGNSVECVFIPEGKRGGALCVSSQVGCKMGCKFCCTATQGFTRNLTTPEIIAQVVHCRDYVQEWGKLLETRKFSNIVMMGQGEPLNNYDNLVKALNIMSDGEGLSISKRRITVSTCGIANKIVSLGIDTDVKLAISLHAVNDEKRSKIMPINKAFPIKKLMAEIRKYPNLSNSRRVTFEYIMIDGLNDTKQDALDLIKLLKGIPAKINLIGFNEWEGSSFKRSSPEAMKRFSDILTRAGYICPIRTPRGNDISAACGQLKNKS
ncbi:MAG: 23S rRNA (adenine(2503)-C(2))-methyltransferase RlmN [Alphaproteobacteria bacterium]|jgi:23S rRNA (adenine2503-C2)-methyltransferase|nr:23S rRNA (adenine(2503)-C(2))-methyltransferase RlmN [Alphaproteobacteria bacterium]